MTPSAGYGVGLTCDTSCAACWLDNNSDGVDTKFLCAEDMPKAKLCGSPECHIFARTLNTSSLNLKTQSRRGFIVLWSLTDNYCISVPLSHHSTLPKHNLSKPTLPSLRRIQPLFGHASLNVPCSRCKGRNSFQGASVTSHPLDSGSQDIKAPLQDRLSLAQMPPSRKTSTTTYSERLTSHQPQ